MADSSSGASDQKDNVYSSPNFTNKKISVRLDDSNYLLWKQQVAFMVKQHKLRGFLEGTVKIPERKICGANSSIVDNLEYENYEALDSALASWLLSSVHPSILPELVGLETSAQIWSKLNRIYSNKSASKILHYQNVLSNQMKRELKMRDYLAAIKTTCDHLAMLGEPVSEQSHISQILKGLNGEYESIIAIVNASANTSSRFDLDTV